MADVGFLAIRENTDNAQNKLIDGIMLNRQSLPAVSAIPVPSLLDSTVLYVFPIRHPDLEHQEYATLFPYKGTACKQRCNTNDISTGII